MKKNITIILSFFLIFSLSSCDMPWDKKDKMAKTEKKQEIKKQYTLVKETEELEKKQKTETGSLEETNSGTTEKTQTGTTKEEEIKKVEVEKEKPKIVSQKTMLIFDASGSMWGKIDGKTKIEIAREVIKKTLNNFKETELGLMAYGHRKKGDCSDIEILTEPAKNNGEKISNFIDKIAPKGMTPMGDSVLKAAESLKYSEEKATIILVSDGIETCGVDLCALGKKLEETGVDFTAHVIGFDMSEEQVAGLKCLAKETGGTFTSAKNADDLGDALKKTVEAASCSKEKLGEAIITAPKEVDAGSEFKISYTGPKNENDNISILPKDSINLNAHLSYFYVQDDAELIAPIEDGEYDIVYFANCGTILGRTTIMVKKVSSSITAPAEVGVGSYFKIEFTGPKNRGDNISILPKGSTDPNNHLNYFYPATAEPELIAPIEIGEYDIVYFAEGKKELARTTFKSVEVSGGITAPLEVKIGSDFKIEFIGPKNEGDIISILPKGSTDPNSHLNYFYPATAEPELIAPIEIGEYDIVYFVNGEKELTRTTFKTINVNACIKAPAEVKAETYFKIEFTGPKNRGDNIAIMPIGSENSNDNLNYFYPETGESELNAPTKTGKYDIVYWLNGEKEIARTTFTVIK